MSSFVSARPALLLMTAFVAACGAASETAPTPTPTDTVKTQNVPCATGSLQLSVNQAARVDCSNGGTTVTLTGNGASYLVVPEMAAEGVPNTPVPFRIGLGSGASATFAGNFLSASASLARPALSLAAIGGAPVDGGVGTPAYPVPGAEQRTFDLALRAGARATYKAGAQTPLNVAYSIARANAYTAPAVGSLANFQIRATFSTTNPKWKTVTARLAYAGSNVLLYIDTLAPAGGFTQAQLQTFGQYFDQTLYPIDVNAFGPPSDLDANGAVIMLMSPAVNALSPKATCNTQGYVEGYFDEIDLGNLTSPNSNKGEIFYSIVPDTGGTVSCAHDVNQLVQTLPATFLHELQHLISFSQHYVLRGGNPQEGWLDEGMSILAEELGSLYYEAKCPPPACRTNPAQLFPDSSQGFIQGFFYDSYQWALRPDTASMTLHDDSQDGFSWRGGDWLLVHWLYDQKGPSVLKAIEQTTNIGIPSIEAAAGEPFPGIFSDLGIAMYTDSLPGLPRTTAPARNRFLSRNLRQMYNRLYVTSTAANNGRPTSDVPRSFPTIVTSIGATVDTASMVPGTMSYFRLDTSAGSSTVQLQFAGSTGAAIPAAYKPQIAIYRLPPGQ